MAGIDPGFDKGLFLPPPAVWAYAQRKLSALFDGTIATSQLIDQVVEGRSKIVTDLTNNDSSLDGRKDQPVFDNWLELRKLRIELNDHGIMIDAVDHINEVFQLLNVFVSPVIRSKAPLSGWESMARH